MLEEFDRFCWDLFLHYKMEYLQQQSNCITQEFYKMHWILVFFVLKKRNYVDIGLSSIEKHYVDISYLDLTQE